MTRFEVRVNVERLGVMQHVVKAPDQHAAYARAKKAHTGHKVTLKGIRALHDYEATQ